jgi:hypothetical protein
MDFEAFLYDDKNNDSFGYLVEEWEDFVMDDLEEQLAAMAAVSQLERNFRWQHTCLNWEEHVAKLLHENAFGYTYRMSLDAFNNLVELLQEDITADPRMALVSTGDPIYPEMVVAIGLHYLASGSYIDIKNMYHLSKAGVYLC